MAKRVRRTREEIEAENKLSESKRSPEEMRMSEVDRIREEAISRVVAREARGGNMDSYNYKLKIDLDIFRELYPGFYPRWFNDNRARISQMQELGWSIVPPHSRLPVGDPAIGGGNTDLGDRISVIAGADNTKEEGAYRTVLMMIPDELWKKRKAYKKADIDEIDKAINAHKKGEGAGAEVERSYKPGTLQP